MAVESSSQQLPVSDQALERTRVGGRYMRIRQIGVGAQATVWECADLRAPSAGVQPLPRALTLEIATRSPHRLPVVGSTQGVADSDSFQRVACKSFRLSGTAAASAASSFNAFSSAAPAAPPLECLSAFNGGHCGSELAHLRQSPLMRLDAFAEVSSLELVTGHPNIVRLLDVVVEPPTRHQPAVGEAANDDRRTPNVAARGCRADSPRGDGKKASVTNKNRGSNESPRHTAAVSSSSNRWWVHVIMEYTEAEDLLTEIVKRGPLRESDAAAVFRQLASAVAFCHASGVIHRDIKPDNVLLTRPRAPPPPCCCAGGGEAAGVEAGMRGDGVGGGGSGGGDADGGGWGGWRNGRSGGEGEGRRGGGEGAGVERLGRVDGRQRSSAGVERYPKPGLKAMRGAVRIREVDGAVTKCEGASASEGPLSPIHPMKNGSLSSASSLPSSPPSPPTTPSPSSTFSPSSSPFSSSPPSPSSPSSPFSPFSTRTPSSTPSPSSSPPAYPMIRAPPCHPGSFPTSLTLSPQASPPPPPSNTRCRPSSSLPAPSSSHSSPPSPSTYPHSSPCRSPPRFPLHSPLRSPLQSPPHPRHPPATPIPAPASTSTTPPSPSPSPSPSSHPAPPPDRSSFIVKLADFALSAHVDGGPKGRTADAGAGTRLYMAPELLGGDGRRGRGSVDGYGCKVDVWSMGVTLAAMLTGRIPAMPICFKGAAWKGVSADAKDLIRRMLQEDVDRRLSSFEVLEHRWLLQSGAATRATRKCECQHTPTAAAAVTPAAAAAAAASGAAAAASTIAAGAAATPATTSAVGAAFLHSLCA